MVAITFDTHLFVRRLRETGITEPQAEVIIDVMRDAVTSSEVATKNDVEVVKLELKRDIETVRKEIAATKSELVRWVVGADFLQIALIAALLMKMIK
jgi:hypothetical protein